MRIVRLGALCAVAACGGGTYGDVTAPGTNPPPTTSTRVPITEMGAATYLGFGGGLYPAGNAPPAAHDGEGRAAAARIVPRDAAGAPSASGRYVLLSIGMSNTTQEWCSGSGTTCDSFSFTGQALADPAVNKTTLVIANGAMGGQTASTFDQPTDANYDRIRDQVLAPQGLSERQVQAAWVKVANAGPNTSLPSENADAYTLVQQMGNIARALKQRYPNLQQVFFSSRTFAGFATTNLNPEPYAYESGFAVKWVVQAQIAQANTATADARAGDLRYSATPWLAWGPYIWSGQTNTSYGSITWTQADFQSDGTHPATSGRQKVGAALLAFFKGSPHTSCWFLAGQFCS